MNDFVLLFLLAFGIFVLIQFVKVLLRMRKHDKDTMNDYKNSEMGKKTREDYIKKIDEIKRKKDK